MFKHNQIVIESINQKFDPIDKQRMYHTNILIALSIESPYQPYHRSLPSYILFL